MRDDEGDIDGSGGPDIEPVDKYLQEIPSNYDDILGSSIEVNLDDLYNLGKRAMDSARKREKNKLVNCDPLQRNLSTDTYQHPRFIADFKNVKKYNEYCLINTKFDDMNNLI